MNPHCLANLQLWVESDDLGELQQLGVATLPQYWASDIHLSVERNQMMQKRIILHSVLMLVLAACGSATSASPIDTPTAAPTPIPETHTPAPTLAPTDTLAPISQFQSFPGARCCNGASVEPGEYELPSWVGIPLTMQVGEGWQVVNEKAARLFMLGKGENIFKDPTQAFVFIAIPGANPQTILESIQRDKALTPGGEMTERTLAGFSGLQLDLSAKPNPDYEGDKEAEIPPGVQFLTSVGKYFAEGFFWTTWSAEARLRFIALNVGDHVLLFQIDAPPAEFESFAAEADQVLQTLELRK
jgi:hypothetical protein